MHRIVSSSVENKKSLCLLDELLKGTKPKVRDIVEPEVIKDLADCGVLTVMTTHNSRLTELAAEDDKIKTIIL